MGEAFDVKIRKYYEIEFKSGLNPIFEELEITIKDGELEDFPILHNDDAMTDSDGSYKLNDEDMDLVIAYHPKFITLNGKRYELRVENCTLITMINQFAKTAPEKGKVTLKELKTISESSYDLVWG